MFGVFIILHGLVHLLYFAQSQRLFELRPNMTWPDGSWAFSNLIGESVTRVLASFTYFLVAISFVAGGIGILFGQAWGRSLILGSAVFSSIIIILFWDGKMQKLDDKGGVGLLINITILATSLIFQRP
jgi:hypothetical protein